MPFILSHPAQAVLQYAQMQYLWIELVPPGGIESAIDLYRTVLCMRNLTIQNLRRTRKRACGVRFRHHCSAVWKRTSPLKTGENEKNQEA